MMVFDRDAEVVIKEGEDRHGGRHGDRHAPHGSGRAGGNKQAREADTAFLKSECFDTGRKTGRDRRGYIATFTRPAWQGVGGRGFF